MPIANYFVSFLSIRRYLLIAFLLSFQFYFEGAAQLRPLASPSNPSPQPSKKPSSRTPSIPFSTKPKSTFIATGSPTTRVPTSTITRSPSFYYPTYIPTSKFAKTTQPAASQVPTLKPTAVSSVPPKVQTTDSPYSYSQSGKGGGGPLTNRPTAAPSCRPTIGIIYISPIRPESVRRISPTRSPSGPSRSPTVYPTNPTCRPTCMPSNPTFGPTEEPTYAPSRH